MQRTIVAVRALTVHISSGAPIQPSDSLPHDALLNAAFREACSLLGEAGAAFKGNMLVDRAFNDFLSNIVKMGKFAGDRTMVQLLEQELNTAPPSKKAIKDRFGDCTAHCTFVWLCRALNFVLRTFQLMSAAIKANQPTINLKEAYETSLAQYHGRLEVFGVKLMCSTTCPMDWLMQSFGATYDEIHELTAELEKLMKICAPIETIMS
jgi:hypothetical protein